MQRRCIISCSPVFNCLHIREKESHSGFGEEDEPLSPFNSAPVLGDWSVCILLSQQIKLNTMTFKSKKR